MPVGDTVAAGRSTSTVKLSFCSVGICVSTAEEASVGTPETIRSLSAVRGVSGATNADGSGLGVPGLFDDAQVELSGCCTNGLAVGSGNPITDWVALTVGDSSVTVGDLSEALTETELGAAVGRVEATVVDGAGVTLGRAGGSGAELELVGGSDSAAVDGADALDSLEGATVGGGVLGRVGGSGAELALALDSVGTPLTGCVDGEADSAAVDGIGVLEGTTVGVGGVLGQAEGTGAVLATDGDAVGGALLGCSVGDADSAAVDGTYVMALDLDTAADIFFTTGGGFVQQRSCVKSSIQHGPPFVPDPVEQHVLQSNPSKKQVSSLLYSQVNSL